MGLKRRIGLIVNPIAGMGGAVGLKGTDGERASRARELGALATAGQRCTRALTAIADVIEDAEWLTAAGSMGEDALVDAGVAPSIVYRPDKIETSADDTRTTALAMKTAGVDLILFAGGDGTATDIASAVDRHIPLLGIPAGVKMHSAVFAVSPRAAGEVVRATIEARDLTTLLEEVEIMDRPGDEASPELLGYVKTPVVPMLVAQGKAAAQIGSVEGACRRALRKIRETAGPVFLGPGTTMRRLKNELGIHATLLGVDAWRNGSSIGTDLAAKDILELLPDRVSKGDQQPLLVVGVVGGQGFLFGRGNQQLSAEVLRRFDRGRILVVSSLEKLTALPERRLAIDTGDDELDAALSGYLPVIIGERQTVQIPVGDPGQSLAAHHG